MPYHDAHNLLPGPFHRPILSLSGKKIKMKEITCHLKGLNQVEEILRVPK
jgi:hypothetical protein